jgi:hypothetical protein
MNFTANNFNKLMTKTDKNFSKPKSSHLSMSLYHNRSSFKSKSNKFFIKKILGFKLKLI